MKDKIKNYLDKVLNLIIRDTNVDIPNNKVWLPGGMYDEGFEYFDIRDNSMRFTARDYLSNNRSIWFESYCQNYYGLTEEESGYLWNQYRKILNKELEYYY